MIKFNTALDKRWRDANRLAERERTRMEKAYELEKEAYELDQVVYDASIPSYAHALERFILVERMAVRIGLKRALETYGKDNPVYQAAQDREKALDVQEAAYRLLTL